MDIEQVFDLNAWGRIHKKQKALAEIEAACQKARTASEDALNAAIPEIHEAFDRLRQAHLPSQGNGERVCRVCGCTDARPCIVDGEACHWVEFDLCSVCDAEEEARIAKQIDGEPMPPPKRRPPHKSTKAKKSPRIAICHICRANFEYTKKGPIPKKPVCGRLTCAPVDGSHAGPPRRKRPVRD